MTDLRKRFIEDMQVRGMAERTIDTYSRAFLLLAKHFNKSPEIITDEELRQYFLYNKNIRKWSRTSSKIALCGIKFFYTHTLKRPWTTLKFVRPDKEKRLPVVLSRNEIRRILNKVKFFHHRTCLATIYSLGLRLQEGIHLHVADIDSDRMFIHIHRGKGNFAHRRFASSSG